MRLGTRAVGAAVVGMMVLLVIAGVYIQLMLVLNVEFAHFHTTRRQLRET